MTSEKKQKKKSDNSRRKNDSKKTTNIEFAKEDSAQTTRPVTFENINGNQMSTEERTQCFYKSWNYQYNVCIHWQLHSSQGNLLDQWSVFW